LAEIADVLGMELVLQVKKNGSLWGLHRYIIKMN
jgi:hypothetical protein